MKYEIITENITKEQADKLYNYLTYLQKGILPQKFKEVSKWKLHPTE